MKVKVKNINGTARFKEPSCGCKTWLEHWVQNSGYNLKDFCRRCHSHVVKDELVGGHVMKVNSADKDYYIVPICRKCNGKKDKIFEVEEEILVAVTVCKK